MTTEELDTKIEQLLYQRRQLPADTPLEACNELQDEIERLRVERVRVENYTRRSVKISRIPPIDAPALHRTGETPLDWSKCSVCCAPAGTTRLVRDHCHKSGIIRGILCDRCNSWLGIFGSTGRGSARYKRWATKYRLRILGYLRQSTGVPYSPQMTIEQKRQRAES
jgi:Recombination endonuclease VII